jgi:hypothetical protein
LLTLRRRELTLTPNGNDFVEGGIASLNLDRLGKIVVVLAAILLRV